MPNTLQMDRYRFGVHLAEGFEHGPPANNALVGVVAGSDSDFEPCLQYTCAMLEQLQIPFEGCVTSEHRTPERLALYARTAAQRGLQVIIACAGGSAHLPGADASKTQLPVLAVAPNKPEHDLAAVYSTIRMPGGVPCAFIGCGPAGGKNAALFAARMLALQHPEIARNLAAFVAQQAADVPWNLC